MKSRKPLGSFESEIFQDVKVPGAEWAEVNRQVAEATARLDALIRESEAQQVSFKGWATPGNSLGSATLDLARTVCRRAERRVCALQEAKELQNPELMVYLNRLADVLWLLARWVEGQEHPAESP